MGHSKYSAISVDLRNRFLANLPILFLYSLAINVLIMAGPLFMLQVYDRVIPSQSIPTLSGLFTLVLVLFMFLSLFEFIRSRIITRIAYYVDRRANSSGMSGNVLEGIGDKSGKKNAAEPASRIRDFLRSGGIESFLDLLFVPVYLICLSALHPLLSLVCLLGSFTMGAVTILSNYLSKPLKAQTGQMRMAEKSLEGQYASHAREISSMGMAPVLMQDLRNAHGRSLSLTHTLLSKTQFFKSISKGIRPLVQASTLAAGAYLVINGELTAGTMIASSIMAGRLLQPIDQSINYWPEFVLARKAYEKLKHLPDAESVDAGLSLSRPAGAVEVSGITVLNKEKMAKGLAQPILRDINFSLNRGDGLCIAGPSGAGKSILIDLLIGHIAADRGELRLDGSKLQQWDKDKLGQYIGFLPQNARPMPGTIAQNISRFAKEEDLEAIIQAAILCGIHERILTLPDGYNTEIDDRKLDQPAALIQMICLARAIYGNPSILILDEPAANLDHESEQALVKCIHQMRMEGATVIVATHRRFISQYLSKTLILNKGVQVSLEDNHQAAATEDLVTSKRAAA
ncbi:MAG: ATP-binding cassette domain-containing protein [Rhizobiaceae bacterium]|nr:ATP-binding cassette domain-containing protein [Rhizobiaceae bacterium]